MCWEENNNWDVSFPFACPLTLISFFRDPGVKRTLCKGCYIVLVPGITARTRVRCEFFQFHPLSYINWYVDSEFILWSLHFVYLFRVFNNSKDTCTSEYENQTVNH